MIFSNCMLCVHVDIALYAFASPQARMPSLQTYFNERKVNETLSTILVVSTLQKKCYTLKPLSFEMLALSIHSVVCSLCFMCILCFTHRNRKIHILAELCLLNKLNRMNSSKPSTSFSLATFLFRSLQNSIHLF